MNHDQLAQRGLDRIIPPLERAVQKQKIDRAAQEATLARLGTTTDLVGPFYGEALQLLDQPVADVETIASRVRPASKWSRLSGWL
jgi:hypothetical protein